MPQIRNLLIDGARVLAGANVAPGTGVGVTRYGRLVDRIKIGFKDKALTVADTGGANGGFVAFPFMTFPATHLLLMGALLDFTSVLAAATIVATGTVKFALGSVAEAANDTLDGTSGDYIASADCVLVAGAGTVKAASPATPVMINALAGTVTPFLNIGVANADISASTIVTLTGAITLFYVEIRS